MPAKNDMHPCETANAVENNTRRTSAAANRRAGVAWLAAALAPRVLFKAKCAHETESRTINI